MNTRHITLIVFSLATLLSPDSVVRAADLMPAAQLNAVVQKYCGSCHSDALMYGGLSVQHFDAAHSEPAVASMLVSKLTGGRTPAEINAAGSGPDAAAKILGLMKRGAMGAGGIGVPDEPTQLAFVETLAADAAGAGEWDSRWAENPATKSRTFTATIVRQLLSTKFADATDMYRLILTCNTATREGELRLAWANGVPDEGQPITVAVDGKALFTHKAEGGKKQGNGNNGPGATVLYPNADGAMTLPKQSLTIGNLFPEETVTFPFDQLRAGDRQNLSTCFAGER